MVYARQVSTENNFEIILKEIQILEQCFKPYQLHLTLIIDTLNVERFTNIKIFLITLKAISAL